MITLVFRWDLRESEKLDTLSKLWITVKILILKEQNLHFCIRLDMRMEVEYPQEVIFENFVLYF